MSPNRIDVHHHFNPDFYADGKEATLTIVASHQLTLYRSTEFPWRRPIRVACAILVQGSG